MPKKTFFQSFGPLVIIPLIAIAVLFVAEYVMLNYLQGELALHFTVLGFMAIVFTIAGALFAETWFEAMALPLWLSFLGILTGFAIDELFAIGLGLAICWILSLAVAYCRFFLPVRFSFLPKKTTAMANRKPI